MPFSYETRLPPDLKDILDAGPQSYDKTLQSPLTRQNVVITPMQLLDACACMLYRLCILQDAPGRFKFEESPLHEAAVRGFPELMAPLLKGDADVNVVDSEVHAF